MKMIIAEEVPGQELIINCEFGEQQVFKRHYSLREGHVLLEIPDENTAMGQAIKLIQGDEYLRKTLESYTSFFVGRDSKSFITLKFKVFVVGNVWPFQCEEIQAMSDQIQMRLIGVSISRDSTGPTADLTREGRWQTKQELDWRALEEFAFATKFVLPPVLMSYDNLVEGYQMGVDLSQDYTSVLAAEYGLANQKIIGCREYQAVSQ